MEHISRKTLVIGGASSGKSFFAENLIGDGTREAIYVATAQAFDEEMEEKIRLHKAQRADRGWTTREVPLDLPAALGDFSARDTVLIDCMTMWLTNLLMAERDVAAAIDALLDALSGNTSRIVFVSNEVGCGIVPDNALARRFRIAQGQLNTRLAAQCDCVVQVIAGLPNVLKGAL